jgi:uncharacterized protein (DUF302 family)
MKFKQSLVQLLVAVVVVFAFGATQTLQAQNTGLVTVQSSQNFDKTISSFKKLVSDNGMMVMGEINQGKVLSMTGISVKSHTFFDCNPNVGNQLFSADRAVGAVVPVRVNIFEETDGHTYVAYFPPSGQLSGLKNDTVNKVAQMLDQKLNTLTSMLGK